MPWVVRDAIAAWDQRYPTAIDLWRPVDAIQQAGTEGNAGTTKDAGWAPLSSGTAANTFSSFPACVSGHATFGGAWSRAMENEFEERTSVSFADAREEDAESRIWLGVHYRVDAVDGLATGRSVADRVDGNELRPAASTGWDCADSWRRSGRRARVARVATRARAPDTFDAEWLESGVGWRRPPRWSLLPRRCRR